VAKIGFVRCGSPVVGHFLDGHADAKKLPRDKAPTSENSGQNSIERLIESWESQRHHGKLELVTESSAKHS